MNYSKHLFKNFATRWFLASLVVLIFCTRALAQPAPEPPSRWLFIFDTSSAMKKRLPAIKAELGTIFLSAVSGQLRAGDSIGVWTFDQKLHAGSFPLITWKPAQAAKISSSLETFVLGQNYSGKTHFAALLPTLGQVIDNSGRLTIVIFCDGDDTFKLTPYDDAINHTLQQSLAKQRDSHQPFVLVVRTQNGQFIGATVNLPPGNLEVPAFPAPPVVIQTPTPAPVIPPPVIVPPSQPLQATVVAPPLIIIGTNVGTNLEELKKIDEQQKTPPPVQVIVVTNFVTVPSITNPPPTNTETAVVVTPTPPPAPVTNLPVVENIKPPAAPIAVAPVPASISESKASATAGDDNNDSGTRTLIYVGTGLLMAAIALILFLALRSPRAPRESLITSSLRNDTHSPVKK